MSYLISSSRLSEAAARWRTAEVELETVRHVQSEIRVLPGD